MTEAHIEVAAKDDVVTLMSDADGFLNKFATECDGFTKMARGP